MSRPCLTPTDTKPAQRRRRRRRGVRVAPPLSHRQPCQPARRASHMHAMMFEFSPAIQIGDKPFEKRERKREREMPASGWRPYSLLKRCQVLRVRVCSTCPRTTGWPDSLALHQFVLFVKFRPLKHFTRQSARASNHTRSNPVFLVLTWNKKNHI